MSKTAIALAALLVAARPASAQPPQPATSIAGEWLITTQTMQGASTAHITFKQDGDKVSGVLKSRMGDLPFEGGTLTGSDLKFVINFPVQGQSLEVTLAGKVDGPSMAGKAQFGAFGEGDWSAKRVEETATTTETPAATSTPATTSTSSTTSTSGVAGKWDVVVKTQMGDLPVSAELTEAAGKITGTLVGPLGPVEVTGTLDGSTLKLSFNAPTPQGDIPVTMTGDLTGDSISGKADFGGMGQAEWTAKRKP